MRRGCRSVRRAMDDVTAPAPALPVPAAPVDPDAAGASFVPAAAVPTAVPGPVPRRLRVAVLFGGRSSEHPVSVMTATSVLRVLDPRRFDVVPVGITRDGRWVLASGAPAALGAPADGGRGLPEVDPAGDPVVLSPGGGRLDGGTTEPAEMTEPAGPAGPVDPATGDTPVAPDDPARPGPAPTGLGTAGALGAVDVVLPLLHGAFGEDGTLQGLLEMAGVRYVGSGVLASALAMDKAMTKTVLAAAGLPVGRWVTLTPAETAAAAVPEPPAAVSDLPAALADRVSGLGYPVFVKPARAGSSFGVSRVTGPDGLAGAVAEAARHDPRVIVEAAVVGREIECGVLSGRDGGAPEVSVCGEIVLDASRDHYDFEAKYLSDRTELAVPADLEPAVADAARALAAQAFTALGCEGLARVDLFLRPDGQLVVNEVNTMPGFTPTSMFPRVWQASGLEYPDLVARLVETAAARPLGLR